MCGKAVRRRLKEAKERGGKETGMHSIGRGRNGEVGGRNRGNGKRAWNGQRKREYVEESRGRLPTSDGERVSWPMYFDTMLAVEPEHVEHK